MADGAGPSEAVFDSDNAMNLTRPDVLTSGRACDSVASANEVAGDGPCTGGACSVTKIARSHVGKGAVNGESVRMISQAAITFPNIGVFWSSRKIGAKRSFAT